LTSGAPGDTRLVDDPDTGTTTAEAERARERLGVGLPALFGSVFVAFVIVAVVVLGARYLF
jgi:hypothetical protein